MANNILKNPLVLIGLIVLAVFFLGKHSADTQSLMGIQIIDKRVVTPSITNNGNLQAEVTVKYPSIVGAKGFIVEAHVLPPNVAQSVVQETIGPGDNCDYLVGRAPNAAYPTKWFENWYDWVTTGSETVKYTFTWQDGLRDADLPVGQNNVYFTIYHVPLTSATTFAGACEAVRSSQYSGQVGTNIINRFVGTFNLQAGQCVAGTEEFRTTNDCQERKICKPDETWGSWLKVDPDCGRICDDGATRTNNGCAESCIQGAWHKDDVNCQITPTTPPKDDDFFKKYGLWIALGVGLLVVVMMLGGKKK